MDSFYKTIHRCPVCGSDDITFEFLVTIRLKAARCDRCGESGESYLFVQERAA